ncbi:ornithine--oxo-acid transaminase [candidate division KSB1 bacterium]|nr:ornithine--oxo-acid transaminase [candidate division KSB1 bacterium]RQW00186.1 MAG: ornithine--oxo-acid transaminase [candidate division KSB1 bacterium]
MTSQDYIQLEEQYGAHNYNPLDVVIDRGDGIWVTDVDGLHYMDFLSAYSAVNQGHCHPRLVKKMQEQCAKMTLTSRAFRNDQLPLLLQELKNLTGFDRALLMNSGAEAVETAIKAARKWGYTKKGIKADKAEIIVATNNFHGRTTTIVGFSTEEKYKWGFGPFTPGFIAVPYGDADAMHTAISPNTAAILLEPVQGEGGIIIPPDGYLEQIQRLCCENNVLFILDEIQSGLGRCGKLFAYQYENVNPDGLVIGKALSGGFYPVSAFLARETVMEVFQPGDHGSTFGGNPLGCAVAREALRILVDEKLAERSFALGSYFRAKLNLISSTAIKEIRGKGLMIGIELAPEAGGARRICMALKNEGLLCKETHDTVIRLTPPLIIKKKELDWAFGKIKKVFG